MEKRRLFWPCKYYTFYKHHQSILCKTLLLIYDFNNLLKDIHLVILHNVAPSLFV